MPPAFSCNSRDSSSAPARTAKCNGGWKNSGNNTKRRWRRPCGIRPLSTARPAGPRTRICGKRATLSRLPPLTPLLRLPRLLRHPDTNQVLGQIHWDKVGHLLTVAATQKGKSSTLVVPNLLRYRGSCVVLDPKGELYRDNRRMASNPGAGLQHRAVHGWHRQFRPAAPHQDHFDARAMAGVLIADDPRRSRSFGMNAIAFLAAVILSVAEGAPPHRRTMQEIRSITSGNDMLDYARDLVRPDAGTRQSGKIVLGKRPESLSTLMQTINTHLAIFDDGNLSATAGKAVDFRTLKDQTATVYINVPFGKMSTYSPYLKLVLTTALDAMLINERKPDIPVLFLLDEFLSLKHFPEFRTPSARIRARGCGSGSSSRTRRRSKNTTRTPGRPFSTPR